MAAISSNTTQAQGIRTLFTKLGFASAEIDKVITNVFQKYIGNSGYTAAIEAFLKAANAPSPAQSSSWKWSATLDGCCIAPKSHEVLLNNPKARLLRVTIPPNTTEPIHTHGVPSVMLVLEPTKIAFYDLKEVPEASWPAEMAKPRPPFDSTVGAFALPPEPPHAVGNLDQNKTYLALRLELKS